MSTIQHEAYSLDEVLLPELVDNQSSEPFQVSSIETANWALRKLLDAQHQLAKLRDAAKSFKARVDRWFEESSKEAKGSVEFFESLLRPWVQSELQKRSGRSKTIPLPSGTVGLRKLPDRVDVSDPEIALQYCAESLPEAVVIKRDVSKTVIKKAMAKGEAVPGVVIQRGTEALVVKGLLE